MTLTKLSTLVIMLVCVNQISKILSIPPPNNQKCEVEIYIDSKKHATVFEYSSSSETATGCGIKIDINKKAYEEAIKSGSNNLPCFTLVNISSKKNIKSHVEPFNDPRVCGISATNGTG